MCYNMWQHQLIELNSTQLNSTSSLAEWRFPPCIELVTLNNRKLAACWKSSLTVDDSMYSGTRNSTQLEIAAEFPLCIKRPHLSFIENQKIHESFLSRLRTNLVLCLFSWSVQMRASSNPFTAMLCLVWLKQTVNFIKLKGYRITLNSSSYL